MEHIQAGLILVVIGILSFFIGFGLFGISWIIAGIIYIVVDREVSEGGFLVALIFGVLGAIVWLLVDMNQQQRIRPSVPIWKHGKYEEEKSYYRPQVSGENPKCSSCMWFGKSRCQRQEKLINAEPCEDFLNNPFKDE